MNLMSNLTGSPETPEEPGTKAWYQRSAFRSLAFTALVTLVGAWATDADIVQTIKDNAVGWLLYLGSGFGLAATTKSGKVHKE